ncbi:MAG TPA: YtxH domain-containing protein [Terriglobales bacterium]|nr:YtxH domain-containing protein [Terriglobales bacterium]
MTEHERHGDYQPSDRSTASTAITFLFIGLGIGALAALLFAPRSGRQMRKLLRRKYEDAVEQADELLERGTELFERGSDFAHTATEKVRPIARAAAKHVK